MKGKRLATIVAALILFSFTLSGCNLFGKGGGDNSSMTSSEQSSSEPVSSAAPSSSEPQSSDISNSSEVSSSTDDQVLPIVTDNKEFDALFKQNPIDAAFIKESANASTTAAMTQLSDKYANIWLNEINFAYNKLLSTVNDVDKKALQASQQKWTKDTPGALKKINDSTSSDGGSLAAVEAAGKVMDYYRDRAAKMYRELYNYNKNYSYYFNN